MSIVAGEILTVMRDNVGDGWCEGYNQKGQSGLFPAAYVQVVEAAAPAGKLFKKWQIFLKILNVLKKFFLNFIQLEKVMFAL